MRNRNTYWFNNGRYQEELDGLNNDSLIQLTDPECFEKSLLNALSNIYYDYYNNGMCNNTSGSIRFIMKFNDLLKIPSDYLITVYKVSNTGHYTDIDLELQLEYIADSIIEYIINKDGTVSPNNGTWKDLQEKICFA